MGLDEIVFWTKIFLRKIKKNVKEIFFGFYLIAVLLISVVASMQSESHYGTTMFFLLVVITTYLLVPRISEKIRSINSIEPVTDAKKQVRFFCVFTIGCLLVFLFWFLAYYPGAYSPDSINQYKQAATGRYNDWHPVLHTLLIFTLPLKLTGANASIVFFQIAYFSLVLGIVSTIVYRYSGRWWALILMFPIVLSPWTYNIAMYPWKDVAFAFAATLCMAMAVKIYYDRKTSVIELVILAVLLMMATIFRHNGILFSGTLLVALLFQISLKRWGLLVLFVVVALGLVRGPIYAGLGVEKPGNRVVETMGFPLSVIIYVAKECPECLNEETSDFVERMTRIQPEWKENYNLTGFPSIKYAGDGVDFEVIESSGRLKIMRMMMNCILADPIHSITAIVAMTSVVYGLEINCDHELSIMPNEYEIVYSGNKSLKKKAETYSQLVKKTPIRFFLATIGMPLIVMLAFMLFRTNATKDDFKRVALCTPILTYDFGTMFIMSGAESRFFYVTMLVCPLVVCVMLGKPVNERPKGNDKTFAENTNH